MRRILTSLISLALPVLLCAQGVHDVRVAASDSPASDKALADLVCTGHDDQETIQKAIDAVGTGGTVYLASGNYFIDSFHKAEKGPDYAIKTRRLETATKTSQRRRPHDERYLEAVELRHAVLRA